MQWVWVFVPHKHSLLCTFPVLESWKMLFNLNVLSLLVFIDSHFIFRFPIIGISVLWIVSMVQPLTTNEVKRYTSSLCTVCMVSIASFCFVDILTCSWSVVHSPLVQIIIPHSDYFPNNVFICSAFAYEKREPRWLSQFLNKAFTPVQFSTIH